ncbi:hypothetical protein, partial [Acidithrix ferrooxidans]|uniref:hypothetical protein n=1 Tax=Acidithrix ferrooxidans TaxID=1280514 RepID=UPI001F24EDC2
SGYEFYLSRPRGPTLSSIVALILPFTRVFLRNIRSMQDQRSIGSSPNSRDGLGMESFLFGLARLRSLPLKNKLAEGRS